MDLRRKHSPFPNYGDVRDAYQKGYAYIYFNGVAFRAQVLEILSGPQPDPGWWYAVNASGVKGLVPTNFVVPVSKSCVLFYAGPQQRNTAF